MVPRALVDHDKLAAEIVQIERKLYSEVVRINHSTRDDWTSEPAIHFQVLLSDAARSPDRLHAVTNRLREVISPEIDPLKL